MTKSTKSKSTAKVLAFPATSRQPKRKAADKWSAPVIALGHCTVPSLLFQAQKRLGLSSEELNIVMQLADMWWDADEPPFPAKEKIASRMGVKGRQIQRHLESLEKKGLVRRIARFKGPKHQTSNGYSMAGLVAELKKLEPEFRKLKEQNRLRRQRVETKAS